MAAPELKWFLVPAFLGLQGLIVHWTVANEHPPVPPDLTAFPYSVMDWNFLRDDPVPPEIAALLKADQLLSRSYARQSAGLKANLFIAWFQSQRRGDRQPHS